ncbi:Rv3654c family TadE-like protein [Actinomadura viridis]|uniref:Rv3654c family TadE-like protein n=1 Tax=Actinomadura viridis TaxID=58110 RepID=UPI003697F9C4
MEGRGWRGRGWGDRGSGVVWVVAFMALVWLVGVVAMSVGAIRAARHRADAAADLAALGAAARVPQGAEVACRVAREIVAGAGGRLAGCRLRGEIVEVSVVLALNAPFEAGEIEIVSRARAGPAGLGSRNLTFPQSVVLRVNRCHGTWPP